jgi:hypothetical protein
MSGPGKRKIDGWEIWENLSRFSGGQDYHKREVRVAETKRENGSWKLENGKEKLGMRPNL